MARHHTFRFTAGLGIVLLTALIFGLGRVSAERTGWEKGRGWGWVWGPEDEVGALNSVTEDTVLEALSLVKKGKIYDLGVLFDRTSFKWPGHSPTEIMIFRSPEGVKRMGDFPLSAPELNIRGNAWHSCALFISDNVGTQIDGLGHITSGEDNHWYNGFKESQYGGDWGPRKASADNIPPIVNRAVLIDVAGHKGVDALPSHYIITPEDLEAALKAQGTEIEVGDIVLIRTGMLRYWGETGADHAKLTEHGSAGINLDTARWLIEEHGALAIGSDTSGLEYSPPDPIPGGFVSVHDYLLVQQGVHILEFHNLEGLARDRIYEFCYVATTNKIKGATAGFTLRPLAMI